MGLLLRCGDASNLGGKVVTYLQEPPTLANQGTVVDSATAPTAKPDLAFSSLFGECLSVEHTQGCQKCDSSRGFGTDTLDGLVGFNTRLAIYPTLAIYY